MAKKDINFNTYVERDLTKTNIDWGTVSKNLSESLIKIEDERKKKRAEIESNTLETEGILTTLEEYDNTQLGELALGMSNESAQFLRVQNDLFKRGLISQTDFAQAKQRVLSDWKQFSNVSKQWNADYAEYVKRLDSGEASTLEEWLNTQNEAFGNLENITGYVNPQTGRLSLVEVDPITGLPSDDPGKHVSMNTINNRLKTKYDNVNVPEVVKDSVDYLGALLIEELGSRQEVIGAKGWGTKKDDPKFQKQMRERARTLMTPSNKAVIAGQLNGGKYTYDVNDVTPDSDIVLMEINKLSIPVPAKNPPNKEKIDKMVEDMLYGEMMLQLDAEYTVEKGFEKLSSDVDRLVDEEILSSISTRDVNERKVVVSEALKDNTIDATQAKILNDKLNTAIKEKQVDANIANINSLIDDRELSGQQRTQQMLINADIQNRTLELKEKINKEAENAKIVPYTYRDDNAVAQYGDFEGTGGDYLKDELGDNIKTKITLQDVAQGAGVTTQGFLIGGPVGALTVALGMTAGKYLQKDSLDKVTKTLGTYISGTIDPNLKAKLLEQGPFEVRFNLTDAGELDASKMVFDVGGQEFEFPPTKEGPARDAALKMLRTQGVKTAAMKQWIDEYIIDPMTLAGIANQIAEKDEIEGEGPISYTEFVVKFGDIAANQEEYRKYQEDPANYQPPVSQETEVVVEGDNVFEQ